MPWVVASEAIQGFADGTKVLDETPVEVRKTAELPYVRGVLRDWPLCDTLDLHRVHLHAVFRDEHPKVFDLRLFEFALLWLTEQVSFR